MVAPFGGIYGENPVWPSRWGPPSAAWTGGLNNNPLGRKKDEPWGLGQNLAEVSPGVYRDITPAPSFKPTSQGSTPGQTSTRLSTGDKLPYGADPSARMNISGGVTVPMFSPTGGIGVYLPYPVLGSSTYAEDLAMVSKWYANQGKMLGAAQASPVPNIKEPFQQYKPEKLSGAEYYAGLAGQHPGSYESGNMNIPDFIAPPQTQPPAGTPPGTTGASPYPPGLSASGKGKSWAVDGKGDEWFLSPDDNKWYRYNDYYGEEGVTEEPATAIPANQGLGTQPPTGQTPTGQTIGQVANQPLGAISGGPKFTAGTARGAELPGQAGQFAWPWSKKVTPAPATSGVDMTGWTQQEIDEFNNTGAIPPTKRQGETGAGTTGEDNSFLNQGRYQTVTGKDGNLYTFNRQTGKYLDPITGKEITTQPVIPSKETTAEKLAAQKIRLLPAIVDMFRNNDLDIPPDVTPAEWTQYEKMLDDAISKKEKELIRLANEAKIALEKEKNAELKRQWQLEYDSKQTELNDIRNERQYNRAYQLWFQKYQMEQGRVAALEKQSTNFQTMFTGGLGQMNQSQANAIAAQQTRNTAEQNAITNEIASRKLALEEALAPFRSLGGQPPSRFRPAYQR